MKSAIFGLATMLAVLLAGCRHSNSENGETIPLPAPVSDAVNVYKYDGSIQCEGEGVSVEEMEKELVNAGVDVFCSRKGSDGLARVAVCGASTGFINIYSIHESNLKDAQELGFKEVTTLPGYQDQPCWQP
jgi:hypothetical protein